MYIKLGTALKFHKIKLNFSFIKLCSTVDIKGLCFLYFLILNNTFCRQLQNPNYECLTIIASLRLQYISPFLWIDADVPSKSNTYFVQCKRWSIHAWPLLLFWQLNLNCYFANLTLLLATYLFFFKHQNIWLLLTLQNKLAPCSYESPLQVKRHKYFGIRLS